MKRLPLFLPLLLVALARPAAAQTITLPKEAVGDVGDFISVAAATDGAEVRWFCADAGLSVFPTQLLKDSKTAVVVGKRPGQYRLYAYTCKDNKLSDPASVNVIVGGTPPVPPGPTPPGPNPPAPVPIPTTGLKVLLVYETADLEKLPPKQLDILYAKSVRDYLNAKTTPTTDGGKRGWYIADKDVDFSGESKVWQDAMKRPRTQTPWVIVSNGAGGYEGPLPADVPSMLELLKKFGG